ncbi:SOS response-associated peptidase [Fictibacillus aquaticus]|nr:SOS response-associated peptidase [Fictibacillus aquaticus]
MCGRYFLYADIEVIVDAFDLDQELEYEKRYNIAPSQGVLAVVAGRNAYKAGYLEWGYPVFYEGKAKPVINARAETVSEKQSFRESFAKRRCLILTSGYYEWRPEGRGKQPYRFTKRDEGLFAFAGIWTRNPEKKEKPAACAILTKQADHFFEPYHHRMPMFMSIEEGKKWLSYHDDELTRNSELKLEAIPVSAAVNNVKNNEPGCIEPITN